jgi:hypothetical protein
LQPLWAAPRYLPRDVAVVSPAVPG